MGIGQSALNEVGDRAGSPVGPGQAFCGDHRPAMDLGEKNKAGIDRPPGDAISF
jgi:hypothetical protein